MDVVLTEEEWNVAHEEWSVDALVPKLSSFIKVLNKCAFYYRVYLRCLSIILVSKCDEKFQADIGNSLLVYSDNTFRWDWLIHGGFCTWVILYLRHLFILSFGNSMFSQFKEWVFNFIALFKQFWQHYL